MTKIEFCDQLASEILDTENISISVTIAKGIITLFSSVTFAEKTNQDFFNDNYDEINWMNLKLKNIAEKYKQYHLKTKLVSEQDTIRFDYVFSTTKQAPVKKGLETNTQSFGSFIQFIFKD